MIDEQALAGLLDRKALDAFRKRALNPENPVTRGTAQNSDIYFQTREASNKFYNAIPDMVADAMKQISAITGREYKPFTYYGDPDAENVIVAMGSVNRNDQGDDRLHAQQGRKGRSRHRSPLPSVLAEIPVRRAARFDRQENLRARPHEGARRRTASRSTSTSRRCSTAATNAPLIVGGRYGLSSKDTTPAQMLAVYDNLKRQRAEGPLHGGHRGRRDLHVAARRTERLHLDNAGHVRGPFHRPGRRRHGGRQQELDQDHRQHDRQILPGLLQHTTRRSRAATRPRTCASATSRSRSPYLVNTPDFVACHVPSYLGKYDVLKGLKDGRHVPAQQRCGTPMTTKEHLPDCDEGSTWPSTISTSTSSTRRRSPRRSDSAAGPTRSCRALSSRSTGVIPYEDGQGSR